MTIDDVMNIQLTKCHLPLMAYNDIALREMCENYSRMPMFGRRKFVKIRNGHLTLSIPVQTYNALAFHLSKEPIKSELFQSMTFGDIYRNIPKFSQVPKIGRISARGLCYAFRFLAKELSRCCDIQLDISHWEADLKNWGTVKKQGEAKNERENVLCTDRNTGEMAEQDF